MAPPTIAPPIRPAATPAATPRWALARRRGQRTGDRRDRDEGSKCLLHVLALLEMAPSVGAGFKVTHTLYSKLAVSLREAHNGQSEVNAAGLVA